MEKIDPLKHQSLHNPKEGPQYLLDGTQRRPNAKKKLRNNAPKTPENQTLIFW
jgi:hypothetical protein